ncbi:MAG TPA: Hsp20/alpha crystallin family protein, partial [Trebonia sp.]
DLPGIDPDKDVEVTVSDGMLRIDAERRVEEKREEKGYLHQEVNYGSLSRSLPLPVGITGADISATYRNGVLEIRVPAPRRGDGHEDSHQQILTRPGSSGTAGAVCALTLIRQRDLVKRDYGAACGLARPALRVPPPRPPRTRTPPPSPARKPPRATALAGHAPARAAVRAVRGPDLDLAVTARSAPSEFASARGIRRC